MKLLKGLVFGNERSDIFAAKRNEKKSFDIVPLSRRHVGIARFALLIFVSYFRAQ